MGNIKKLNLINSLLIILVSLSFSIFSFFQMVNYNKIFIFLTILLSFIFSFYFILKTYDENIKYIKQKPFISFIIFILGCIIVYYMKESKDLSNIGLLKNLSFDIFRLRYFIFTIPSVFYLSIFIYRKISNFIKEFFEEMDEKDKRNYFIFTFIFSFIVLILYSFDSSWYMQYDKVYSLDSGWCFKNIFPNTSYYDVRHPILSIFTFPIWTITNKILKFIVPLNLVKLLTAIFIQFINIQLLLLTGFMIKKMSKNKWVFYLYISSFSFIIFSVFFEKYQICTFMLVLYVYLLLKNKKNIQTNLILATGIMPTSILMFFSELFIKESIKEKIIKIVKLTISCVGVLICFGKIHLLNPFILINELNYINEKFTVINITFKQCLYSFINMVQGCFLSLSSEITSKGKYIWFDIIDKISIIGLIILIIIIIGIIFNHKDRFTKICILWAFISFLLFVLYKWSVHESPLFSIYFSWAFIPLFQKGIQSIINKFKLKENYVYYSIITLMLIINSVDLINIIKFLGR